MTGEYSVAFYADKDDLVDGQPPALLAYAALRQVGDIEYERVRDSIRRLIASPPFSEDADDPDLAGGPGSRWARRHLYRLGDDGTIPAEITAFTIWVDTPRNRWWLTWSRDPDQNDRLLIHSLVRAPGS